jgi:glucokinase
MSCPYGLIADIGGTNARFALADDKGYYEEKILKCREFPGPSEMAKAYMDMVGQKDLKCGAFALAGPVDGDFFFSVNLPWQFSLKELSASLGFEDLKFCNDFTAIALSLPHLKETDVRKAGGDDKSHLKSAMAVIGPGTGLGVGGMVYAEGKYHPVPAEGGHSTVPVRTEREFKVVQLLEKEFTHVSAERVCSGQGLENIYRTLRIIDSRGELPELSANEISAAGMEGTCELCRESLDMMMTFLGRVAGNLVLTLGAWRGVYIAGGIVGRLGEYFYNSPFREEFENKGRFTETMKDIPAYVVLHPQPALLGLQSSLV